MYSDWRQPAHSLWRLCVCVCMYECMLHPRSESQTTQTNSCEIKTLSSGCCLFSTRNHTYIAAPKATSAKTKSTITAATVPPQFTPSSCFSSSIIIFFAVDVAMVDGGTVSGHFIELHTLSKSIHTGAGAGARGSCGCGGARGSWRGRSTGAGSTGAGTWAGTTGAGTCAGGSTFWTHFFRDRARRTLEHTFTLGCSWFDPSNSTKNVRKGFCTEEHLRHVSNARHIPIREVYIEVWCVVKHVAHNRSTWGVPTGNILVEGWSLVHVRTNISHVEHAAKVCDACHRPLRNVRVEGIRLREHFVHISDAIYLPLRDVPIEMFRHVEHSARIEHTRHVPLRNIGVEFCCATE